LSQQRVLRLRRAHHNTRARYLPVRCKLGLPNPQARWPPQHKGWVGFPANYRTAVLRRSTRESVADQLPGLFAMQRRHYRLCLHMRRERGWLLPNKNACACSCERDTSGAAPASPVVRLADRRHRPRDAHHHSHVTHAVTVTSSVNAGVPATGPAAPSRFTCPRYSMGTPGMRASVGDAKTTVWGRWHVRRNGPWVPDAAPLCGVQPHTNADRRLNSPAFRRCYSQRVN
jgi:hypothetical protein